MINAVVVAIDPSYETRSAQVTVFRRAMSSRVTPTLGLQQICTFFYCYNVRLLHETQDKAHALLLSAVAIIASCTQILTGPF